MSRDVIRPLGPRRVLIVAGEASGDLHGANLVRAVHRLAPEIRFYGIGGERLREAGAELLFHSSRLAVVGIAEVFGKLRSVSSALGRVKGFLGREAPALAILIDFPDFNLHLATHLKRRGIPILYYISPQIWAWRGWRIRRIRRLVDKMVVILPFEAALYEREGVDVAFVGHPLLDVVKPRLGREKFLDSLGIDPRRRIIGLFPGSREHEVRRLLPAMLGAAQLLEDRNPDLYFLISLAPDIDGDQVSPLLERYGLPVRIVRDNPYDTMDASELLVLASGTVTLEAAILGAPMVIIYKVSPLTYWIGRMMAKVDHIGLVNLVAGRTIAPELIQGCASADRIAREGFCLLADPERSSRMRSALMDVKAKLGMPGASDRAAHLVLDMMSRASECAL
jgi:lipid-A-disaccharide synthase